MTKPSPTPWGTAEIAPTFINDQSPASAGPNETKSATVDTAQMIRKWYELAAKADDLKACLLTYGRYMGAISLKAVQNDFHKAERAFYAYEKKMDKTGMFEWDASAPCIPYVKRQYLNGKGDK